VVRHGRISTNFFLVVKNVFSLILRFLDLCGNDLLLLLIGYTLQEENGEFVWSGPRAAHIGTGRRFEHF
jgi:hypothetical protein